MPAARPRISAGLEHLSAPGWGGTHVSPDCCEAVQCPRHLVPRDKGRAVVDRGGRNQAVRGVLGGHGAAGERRSGARASNTGASVSKTITPLSSRSLPRD